MTISFVAGTFTSADASLATITANFTNNRANNLLVVSAGWIDTAGTTTVTVADTAGNVWRTAAPKIRNATQTYSIQTFYCYDTKPFTGTNTVTFTFNVATTFRRCAIAEWTSTVGPWMNDPFDKTNGATGNSTALNSGNVTPVRDNELIYGWGAAGAGTLAAAGSFTLRTPAAQSAAAVDLFQTAATTVAAVETQSVSGQWVMQVATFFDAVSSSSSSSPLPPDLLDALAAASLAATGERQVGPQTFDATLGVVATITADAASDKPVSATLTGTATATVAAASTKPVDATLTGTATIGAAAVSTKPVDAALTGTATVIASAASDKPVAATLTATATVTAAALSTKPIDATLTNTATVTVAAASTKPVDAALTATASRTVAADSAKPVAAPVSATATITAAAASTKPVDATRSATATITVAAVSDKPISATLTSTATITVDATLGSPPKTFDVNAPFAATITTAAAFTKPIAASLALTATITATMTVGSTSLYGALPVLVTASAAHSETTGTEDERWLTTSATQSPCVTRSTAQPVSSQTPP